MQYTLITGETGTQCDYPLANLPTNCLEARPGQLKQASEVLALVLSLVSLLVLAGTAVLGV